MSLLRDDCAVRVRSGSTGCHLVGRPSCWQRSHATIVVVVIVGPQPDQSSTAVVRVGCRSMSPRRRDCRRAQLGQAFVHPAQGSRRSISHATARDIDRVRPCMHVLHTSSNAHPQHRGDSCAHPSPLWGSILFTLSTIHNFSFFCVLGSQLFIFVPGRGSCCVRVRATPRSYRYQLDVWGCLKSLFALSNDTLCSWTHMVPLAWCFMVRCLPAIACTAPSYTHTHAHTHTHC